MNTNPAEWPVRPFAEVADYNVGRTPARANAAYWDQSREVEPWVTISDMPAYGIIESTKESISDEAFDRVFGGVAVPAGTLLMSFKLTIGRVATLGVPAVHNEAIISIFPRAGIDQRFLGYYLSQVDYTQFQDRQIKGNTLNKSKIDRIPVPVPPEPEQRAIADMLDAVLEAIAVESRSIGSAEELKRAVMNVVFSRGMRQEPLRETESGLMPESWVGVPISDLGEVVTGTTPSTKERSFYDGGAVPFISPGDITHGRTIDNVQRNITDAGLAVARGIPRGSTCVVCIGATIGKVGLATTDVSATNQQINAIVPKPSFNPEYVFYSLVNLEPQIRREATSGPMPLLSKGAFEKLTLSVTYDPAEQESIATTLTAIDEKIGIHNSKRVLLEELFGALLHKLMVGEEVPT